MLLLRAAATAERFAALQRAEPIRAFVLLAPFDRALEADRPSLVADYPIVRMTAMMRTVIAKLERAASRRPLAASAAQLQRVSDRGDRAIIFRARAPSSELRRSSPVAVAVSRRLRRPAAASGTAFAARVVVAGVLQVPQAAARSHPAADSDSVVAGFVPSRTGSSSCRVEARTSRPVPVAVDCCFDPDRRRARPVCRGRSLRRAATVVASAARVEALPWSSFL